MHNVDLRYLYKMYALYQPKDEIAALYHVGN